MDDEKLEREAAKMLFSASAKPEDAEVVRAEPQGPEIAFVCPFCNEAYQVSADLAGQAVKCRNCHEPCRVDAPKTSAPAAVGRSFWLGVIVGVLGTLGIVLVLKFVRLI